MPNGLTVLDIGCGDGFDGEEDVQRSIARVATRYIGVEPARDIGISDVFGMVHRCSFEDAPIEASSVDLAFAVMVLEHLQMPDLFWRKVQEVLRPGGVFWGFTVDSRHWFVAASMLAEKLRIKNLYLELLHGRRGEKRYSNYRTYYRSNNPEQLAALARPFSKLTVLGFQKEGEVDYYLPRALRGIGKLADRCAIKLGLPGSILAVRVEK